MPSVADGPPLRIGLIAALRHGLREPHAGGLERHTVDLATSLRKAGHDVTVFASGQSDPALGVQAICPMDSQLSLSAEARQDISMMTDGFMVEHDAYLRLMIRLEVEGFDVIHDNSLHYLPVAMAASLSCPLVKVLHTPPTPWLESAFRHLASDTMLVSVSHANASRWQVTVDAVIHNAIDLNRFHPVDPGLVTDRAIWFGRIVPEKGPHHALQAAHLADSELVLAGPMGDTTYWRTRVEPLLDQRRRWLGHLSVTELAHEVSRSSVCLVTPLWEEPYGLVVAESLACGTPVVGYRRGALPELVDTDSGILVEPDDVSALAAALPAAARLDRLAARRRAVDIAGLSRMTDEYVQLYRRAMTEAARQRGATGVRVGAPA